MPAKRGAMAVTDRNPLRARTSLAQQALRILHGARTVARASSHLPFNRLYRTGNEEVCIRRTLEAGWTAGNGPQNVRCQALLLALTHGCRAMLTHSCTGALEMAALLARVGPGDEVIMPSFTFASTAVAFALRGAMPVFVDIDPQTLNIDPSLAADAITPRTKALVPVHYAGVGCDMDRLTRIAREHDLILIEDAAQGIGASIHGRALGTLGDLGTLSFHETKTVSCGEGGALLLNDPRWIERAEYLHEKGTNRLSFRRGEVDQYTWMDLGSSFLMSDFTAALLADQLEHVAEIIDARRAIWDAYHAAFLEPGSGPAADIEQTSRPCLRKERCNARTRPCHRVEVAVHLKAILYRTGDIHSARVSRSPLG